MTDYCDHCEQPLPGGCYHMAGNQKDCPLGPRKDKEWRVGMALFRNLSDRRGIKNELTQCQYDIQAEIVETLGAIAIKEATHAR